MNYEEGKERVSSLRQQMAKDGHEYQRNPTCSRDQSRTPERQTKYVSKYHRQADHMIVNGSESEISQGSSSR